MSAPRNRPHIVLREPPRVDGYKPHPRKITPKPIPHSTVGAVRSLKASFQRAVSNAQAQRARIPEKVRGASPGVYVEFESKPDIPLEPKSLQHASRNIEIVAVRQDILDSGTERRAVERATVFVPPKKEDHFEKKFDEYLSATGVKPGERPKRDFVDRLSSVDLAGLKSLWTDPISKFPPKGESAWWEVWLRRSDDAVLERWFEFSSLKGIDNDAHRLEFEDRVVTLARATAEQLAPALLMLGDLVELRSTAGVTKFFLDLPNWEARDWTDDLKERRQPPEPDAAAVCILDTGVNHGHPLLSDFLRASDCHTCEPGWRKDDHHGHGTEMAGLALYGDLGPALEDAGPIQVRNRLESVKILPRTEKNAPQLYAAIVAEATSRVEIEAPNRARVFSMAVTADPEDPVADPVRGQPTSWSAAIDALSVGRAFDPGESRFQYLDDIPLHQRLFVISAGNVPKLDVQHLERSDTEPVQDPGQAWNALVVGAYTDRVYIEDPAHHSWRPVASQGELAPWSTTSVSFIDSWPIKPDVVMEGGNAAYDGGTVDACRDLSLVTTYRRPDMKLLDDTIGTSPAAAQAARLAASVMSEYPDYWPETVRGLLVHSARWTPAMQEWLSPVGKRERLKLVRRYGFGVPSLERALRSADDALTLIAQATIQPFENKKYRQMHVYDLPWPKSELEALGSAAVRLRVTLSYFIEPNPARRGWRGRYNYPSHLLRFEINEPNEEIEPFRKRMNKAALSEDEAKPQKGSSTPWFLGPDQRWRGSLHSDVFESTAAEIASRGAIVVYPVAGWWKESPKRDRSEQGVRYALLVSLETDAEEADLWTPVANAVGVPNRVEILV